MKHSIVIIGLFISINLLGQTLAKKELRYRPKNFNESLVHLDKILPDSSRIQIKSIAEDDFMAFTHLTTGMWIRNYWLYNRYIFGIVVTKSDLRKDLTSKGLFNNDDMSGVILRSYYRKLNNTEIQLDQQIEDIHQWYVNINNPTWRAKQDSISWSNYMQKFEIGDTLTDHVYYDRNWLGKPRKNTIVQAKVIDKSDRQLKVDIISFGTETDKALIYEEIKCDLMNCWTNPYLWKKKDDE